MAQQCLQGFIKVRLNQEDSEAVSFREESHIGINQKKRSFQSEDERRANEIILLADGPPLHKWFKQEDRVIITWRRKHTRIHTHSLTQVKRKWENR